MSATASSGTMRGFRLTNEPGGLGLSCTPSGVALAGVPLIRRTPTGFVPRSAFEIATLLRAAYGDNPTSLQSRLSAIVQALNAGDFVSAMIAAVHTRTPELCPVAAKLLASAEAELVKYNPNEPRDWQGRWTRNGSAESDQSAGSNALDWSPRSGAYTVSPNNASVASDRQDGQAASDADALQQTFERKYDDLGPVDFAKRVIQFGDWLGRSGENLPPDDREFALAEYSFIQDRLSFWLSYGYKPVQAQTNLLSAALTLYQGAINGGIVRVGQLPRSMMDVAGTAVVFTDGPPCRPSAEPNFDDAPSSLAEAPREIEGLGGTVDNSEMNIAWNESIKNQGVPLEAYIEKENPDVVQLKPNATTFDLFDPITGEAISAKTMNTLSVTYIKTPQKIFSRLQLYVNEAVNYEGYWQSDLNPAEIDSKSIYLAVPEWTSPTQWRQLLRALVYGKDNGVSIVITRIRE